MDTSKLKEYAPQARRDFIAAVTNQAAVYGLTAKKIEPIDEKGDVAVIGTRAFPRSVASKRRSLEDRIQREGFEQVMEAIAYTWFNRLVAIRYMELHGYLDHGYRVLSHPEGQGRPEILDHAADVDLPGLDRALAVELKIDGSKDEELYRLLLLSQCNALHQAMPFLFERIGDETELLLPANLLHTDSLIRKLIEGIDESAWEQIEIIGWLYQFYISEKKDQVIGKVVKSEDIPAATQLFTPNWIVKYLIQNSLGALWLATYPESPLKGQMEYYVEPGEQTEEVMAQIHAVTPGTLNPEEVTLIDPACGSGHILVEAYELFKAIYLERGYRLRDVVQLILEKNLFGLEIDARAAQLAGFALMMKGRADDRRLFERGVTLNVMALVDSTGFDAEGLSRSVKLADCGLLPGDLIELKRLFEHATTFGTLIQVHGGLAKKLPALKQLSEGASEDLFVSDALKHLGILVQQAELLAAQYDAVVANPPYMGPKGMNALVKDFAGAHFPYAKNDLFACFVERGYTLAKNGGYDAMVTMQSWMFLSSFEKMRERLLREKTICTMAHLGARAFGSISGEVVQATAFVIRNHSLHGYKPAFFRLRDGGEAEKQKSLARGEKRFDRRSQSDFGSIPGSPVAYWASDKLREAFVRGVPLGEVAEVRHGLTTGKNETVVRYWQEISWQDVGLGCTSDAEAKGGGKKWFPYSKGGAFRKWFGNREFVLRYDERGVEIMASLSGHRHDGKSHYFKPGLTWSDISSSTFAVRRNDAGFVFDATSHSAFPSERKLNAITGLLCSKLASVFLAVLNPTLHFQVGNVASIPVAVCEIDELEHLLDDLVTRAVTVSRRDWDAYERSWEFRVLPVVAACSRSAPTLEESFVAWISNNSEAIAEMKRVEEEINRLFIDAYGLADELTPDVPIEQITLTVNPAYRYGGNLTEEGQWARFRQDSMVELVSYAIGCMMGRYSLDEPGLIYAHSGNEGFDPKRYTTVPADADGILPLTDAEWFSDDACNRLLEFISVAWGANHLEENLTFLADNLSPNKNETSRETLRRYLCDGFFKDHLQTYKRRPVYWLFSSGKQKAFQCLVYLHRYNEGTLARMRTEYVVPLQGMMASRIDQLEGDIAGATSTSHRKKLEKEREALLKRRTELQEFDEKLRHYADLRIVLDLDDGVRVNYGKFGDLLAEVKAVAGATAD